VAEAAENTGFTLVTLQDGPLPPHTVPDPAGRLGAVERAAFLLAATSTLGAAPVVATTYAEPFHVSSQLASLDHISTGRAGWMVGTSPEPEAARAWGRPAVTGDEAVRREARDSVAVSRALWDSWEDDAVIRDVPTSRYLDRDRLHYVDFRAATFTVKGPAIVPRPPQGQLVVFAPHGLLPPELVDVALVSGSDPDSLARTTTGTPLRFAEVEFALDVPGATAQERLAELERHGRWPERGWLRHVGTADGLVRLLRRLAGVVDGVRLHPLVLDEDLSAFHRAVAPTLRTGRTVAAPVPGTSLRTTLGLPRPANRYAGQDAQ
jgi:hypothetical protein